MKKIVALTLALAMVFSMAACGCAHEATESKLISVDTANLTAQWEVSCTQCGELVESTESSTGVAPVDGKMVLSPDEWYACLSTNIQTLGAGQTLFPYPTESDDDAIVHAVVSMYGMLSVASFYDTEGNVLTTSQSEERNLTHSICVEAQFTNDTAKEFFMFLMVMVMTNNSALEAEAANTLCSQIMTGNPAQDNGYTYLMEIVSVEDHTVRVNITAE